MATSIKTLVQKYLNNILQFINGFLKSHDFGSKKILGNTKSNMASQKNMAENGFITKS